MALTTVEYTILNKTNGDRVVARFVDSVMRRFLHDNKVEIYLPKTSKFTRLLDLTPNSKKSGGFEKSACPIPTDLQSDLTRIIQRCADQILGGRTMESLATFDQLIRLDQFIAICQKQKDNWVSKPANFYQLTLGEAGRMIGDIKKKLIKDGMWDELNKCELKKKPRRKKG